ncbi:hypothetical protein LMG22037_05471 [Paraburkholderia phenoliruptrix]|uniref:Uncharacterized protein n=1 Tax=Paraburkholderia phenoliruptrix TaxID=252970 RepID=A0A6J5CA13_9BURK|nr:hypothetical protein [Paraburkholderia phenoliruptrix]CAB3729723.1 hypothetical protein LMG22037_05471 [Paraburkholderia phenoliruptrix]
MSTSYILFCDVYDDPVWGPQFIEYPNSGLVRVFRNRLRKAVFEYVGNPGFRFDLEAVRKRYPVCKYADANEGPIAHGYRRAPLPDRKQAT